MRAATFAPRSARTSPTSMSSSMGGSGLALMTRSAPPVPSELDVRFSPLDSRRHQLSLGASVVSFMARCDTRFATQTKVLPLLDVPQLTAEEIQARVLHRDGLMLIIEQ